MKLTLQDATGIAETVVVASAAVVLFGVFLGTGAALRLIRKVEDRFG